MSTSNRATKLTQAHKILKKHYKPVSPPDRTLLEHLLYACCLENAAPEAADEAFARLQEYYYDWNEVRVTTIAELSEVMATISDAPHAAARLKRTLQSVFETHYAFDLEFLKKQNLGEAVRELERFTGVTEFSIAYATQNGLGGHSIPAGKGAMKALVAIGVISDAEAAQKKVPGMERAIAKSKGIEFGSLLHQLGVDFLSSPHSPRVRGILVEIDPDAKRRLPKRGSKKSDEAEAARAAPTRGRKKVVKAAKSESKPRKTKKAAGARTTSKKKSTTKLKKKKPR